MEQREERERAVGRGRAAEKGQGQRKRSSLPKPGLLRKDRKWEKKKKKKRSTERNGKKRFAVRCRQQPSRGQTAGGVSEPAGAGQQFGAQSGPEGYSTENCHAGTQISGYINALQESQEAKAWKTAAASKIHSQ